MKKFIAICATATSALFVTGCESLSVLNYKPATLSGVDRQVASLYILSESVTNISPKDSASKYFVRVSDNNKNVDNPLSDEEMENLGDNFANALYKCTKNDIRQRSGLIIPVIGFAVQQGVSAFGNYLVDKAKAIESASVRTYGTRTIIGDASEFQDKAKCLLFVRRGPRTNDSEAVVLNFVTLFSFEQQGAKKDSFIAVPLFTRVENSVAWTADNKPISVSIALVGKGARTLDGINKLHVFSDQTVTTSPINFGEDTIGGPSTGLIPLPPDDSTAIEIAVGVTEVGSGAPDVSRVESERSALVEVLGPAIATEVENALQR